MEIEVSRIFRFDGDGPVKAMADIVLEGQFAIKGFKVVNGKKGLFVGAPGRQGKDGRWYDSACAITDEAKQALTETVLKAYEEDEENQ
jgi:stage V sporulation protein G